MSYLNEDQPSDCQTPEKCDSTAGLMDHRWSALSQKIDDADFNAWMDELESQLTELLADNKQFETPRSLRHDLGRSR